MTIAGDCELSPEAAKLVEDIRARQVGDPRTMVSRKESQRIGGWGPTTQLEKEKRGLLRTHLDGSARRVSVPSIYEHLIDLAIASHPVDGPTAKARRPSARYQPGSRSRRKPTAQELEGLRKGNAQRAAEARARHTKEGKTTS